MTSLNKLRALPPKKLFRRWPRSFEAGVPEFQTAAAESLTTKALLQVQTLKGWQ
jgi:hypothetical protein